MSHGASVVWFRNDLRLSDNPALSAAVARGGPVIPLFIWLPEEDGHWPPAAASRWWLHQSLVRLAADLRKHGSRLIIGRGASLEDLEKVLRSAGADAVYWNRRYEPALVERDRHVEQALREAGVHVETFAGNLLFEPSQVATKEHKPYRVFTPFWKACLALGEPSEPLPKPGRWSAPKRWPRSLEIESLGLEPKIDWAAGFREVWTPGEPGAGEQLDQFRAGAFSDYSRGRNRPDIMGTSRLSPHLHFGEITPRQIWHALATKLGERKIQSSTRRAADKIPGRAWLGASLHHVLFHSPSPGKQPTAPCATTSLASHGDATHEPLKARQRGLDWLSGSSTCGCANCGRPAGCTTACG